MSTFRCITDCMSCFIPKNRDLNSPGIPNDSTFRQLLFITEQTEEIRHRGFPMTVAYLPPDQLPATAQKVRKVYECENCGRLFAQEVNWERHFFCWK